MDPSRKPSPRSPLNALPEESQQRLAEFLKASNLAEGVEFCAREFGIKTNDSSLSAWLQRFRTLKTLQDYNLDAEDVAAELAKTTIDPGLIPKLATVFFINRAANSGDAKTFAAAANVVHRDMEIRAAEQVNAEKLAIAKDQVELRRGSLAQMQRKLDQSERKVKALEEKAELARASAERAKGILKDGGMSEQARSALMAEMDFLILGKKKKGGESKDAAATAAK